MSSYTHVYGDIFDYAETHALAHGVNCQGLMGAGIAATMRKRYPGMERFYRLLCTSHALVPGGMFPWHDRETGDVILNCASQNEPGADARLGWLLASLRLAASYCVEQNYELAIPEIGCHIGGLDRDEAFRVFEQIGNEVELTVVTYAAPTPEPTPTLWSEIDLNAHPLKLVSDYPVVTGRDG